MWLVLLCCGFEGEADVGNVSGSWKKTPDSVDLTLVLASDRLEMRAVMSVVEWSLVC